MRKGIPEPARRLIRAHIESGAQLDVLLLIRGSPERLWSAAEVARELRTSTDLAEANLGRFAKAGLAAVEIDVNDRPCFRFAPATPALASASADVAAAYATHKSALIALIFSGPTDSIRGFADAFRLREDDR